MNLNYKEFIFTLFILEILKYIQKKELLADNGSMGGSHWTCFVVKDNKSYYFDSFGVHPDKFLLNQLPEPVTYHIYKIQDIISKLCGSFSLYFFYLIKRMNYYDAILKMYFELVC